MPKTLEETIRRAALLLAKEAPMGELVKVVPTRYLAVASSPSASRMVKKVNHRLTEKEKEAILRTMQGLTRGTPPYRMQVKCLSRDLRVSPRQIGGVMSQLTRERKKEPDF